MGHQKHSGAPLGGCGEVDPPDLAAQDASGNPVIPEDAHVRLGAMARLAGGQMRRRRDYEYNDGANLTAERWPPWRQGIEFDAGLLFVAYQRDPKAGFVRVFEPMGGWMRWVSSRPIPGAPCSPCRRARPRVSGSARRCWARRA